MHGSIGSHALRFIDLLAATGQTVWQILPVGPTHEDGSPYQALSVNAGESALIDLEALVEEDWLRLEDLAALERHGPRERHTRALRLAYEGFLARAEESDREALAAFVRDQSSWLDDYALFVALKREQHHHEWSQWPQPLRDRVASALTKARRRHAALIDEIAFQQFAFFRQWSRLRSYAAERGVLLFGDMPIFVSHDSVDVWVQRRLFDLDEAGVPRVVAGVPPDYFSSTGQRWGNPHYLWETMAADGFKWWRDRVACRGNRPRI